MEASCDEDDDEDEDEDEDEDADVDADADDGDDEECVEKVNAKARRKCRHGICRRRDVEPSDDSEPSGEEGPFSDT